MSSVPSIVLADGQATPVSHTFNRVPSTQSNIIAFRDSTAGLVSAARASITGLFRPAASGNDGAKRVLNVVIPEYDSTLKTTICTARVKIEVLIPEAASDLTRKNVAAYLKNLSAAAVVQNELALDDPMF